MKDLSLKCSYGVAIFAALLLLLWLPLTTFAQERSADDETRTASEPDRSESVVCDTGDDCDDADPAVRPARALDPDSDGDGLGDAVEGASYNNSRSNRATVAAPDTNVCDGVTCADGSCAATADMCGAEEMATDSVCNGYLCDSGECAASAAMCGITEVDEMATDSVCNGYLCDSGQCVSDEMWCGVSFDFEIDSDVTAADSVCNGYLCNDGTCVSSEPMCSIDFSALPAAATKCPSDDPIRCGDGSCASEPGICRAIENPTTSNGNGTAGSNDGTERAQNHNSSRSNRTDGIAADPDFNDPDDDGDGLPSMQRVDDRASPLLFDTLRNAEEPDDGDTSDTTPRFTKFDDIKGEVQTDADTGERRLSRVSVDAQDVRGWTEADRSAFARLQAEVASNTPEAASLQVTERVLNNDRIEELEVSETGVQVRYRAPLRLFGLIPLEREVTARADAAGNTEIDYPWYRFFSSAPDTDTLQELLQIKVEMQMTMAADPI